jgi:hypothetical protein
MKPDVKRILTKLSENKVELSAMSDFKKIFDKTLNKDTKIGNDLIDDLRKAEVKYKDIQSDYKRAYDLSQKVFKQAKDIGVDLPNTFKNQTESTQFGIKESNRMISAIKGLYSKF